MVGVGVGEAKEDAVVATVVGGTEVDGYLGGTVGCGSSHLVAEGIADVGGDLEGIGACGEAEVGCAFDLVAVGVVVVLELSGFAAKEDCACGVGDGEVGFGDVVVAVVSLEKEDHNKGRVLRVVSQMAWAMCRFVASGVQDCREGCAGCSDGSWGFCCLMLQR